jgi:hypothetical protein
MWGFKNMKKNKKNCHEVLLRYDVSLHSMLPI